MDPDTLNALSYSILRGLVTLIQGTMVIVGLASILFLTACLFCALGGEFKQKKQPAVDDRQAEDKGLGDRAAVCAARRDADADARASRGRVPCGVFKRRRIWYHYRAKRQIPC